jgi:superfamily II DNA or RNA helicase
MSLTKDQIQEEALQAIGNLNKAGVSISMGVGKTLLALKHMHKNYNNFSEFLVVAPKLAIFESWKDDAKKFGFEYLLDHIEFVTYRSLIKKNFDYDIIYLDECHSLKSNHSKWLDKYCDDGGKILGLTGTYPERHWTEKGKMCQEYCPLVYKYSTDNAVSDNILNDYRIFVHKLYLNGRDELPVKAKNTTFMTSEVKSYNYWNRRVIDANPGKEAQIARIGRMKALQGFDSKEKYAKKLLDKVTKKTIVFANTIAQADRLCVYSHHSKNKHSKENLQMFKDDEILKLSAVEQLNEGVTVPNLKTGIIMHAYANNRKASQKIGRLLRLNPDDVADVHILCYVNSIDKQWVEDALSAFDENKIKWIDSI